MYYVHTDRLGSYHVITDANGSVVERLSYDAWGNRRADSNWNHYEAAGTKHFFTRGYTGHEHLDAFHIINMNGRLYDPIVARFFSPDPYVQMPDNTQNYNRYSYCLNNPLRYTDPSGEVFVIDDIIIAAAVGAIINCAIQGDNINSGKDFFRAAGIGALSGAIGGIVGQATTAALGTATTFWTSVGSGFVVGGASGGAAGFITGAGNTWSNGGSFKQGLQAGLTAGGYGALGGAALGGITGGIRYRKQMGLFRRGNASLDVNAGDPVSQTDAFLSEAQKAWYPDAPMNMIDNFSTENIPNNILEKFKDPQKLAYTDYGTRVKGLRTVLTGRSSVYFNNTSFSSAKQLFFSMGHEFIHVSQFAALSGLNASLIGEEGFLNLMEFNAYNYQKMIGDGSVGNLIGGCGDVKAYGIMHMKYLEMLNFSKYNWINTIIKPF